MAIPIGLCVKTVREASDLTLRQAAEQIGVSTTFLYKFEEFTTCLNPFARVSKQAFCTAIENFFTSNLKNIKNKLINNYITTILDGKSIETNLFQDCFYHSSLSFLDFSLVQTYEEYGSSYGGLFYILRDLLLFYDNTLGENTAALGHINNDITSYFLVETFNSYWGKNRTKRRKNAYKNEDIVFTHKETPNYLGYLRGNENFIGRVFYEGTFVYLLFYLLLDKFSCSFFVKENNSDQDFEEELWCDFKNDSNLFEEVNYLSDPQIYLFNAPDIPTFRDIFVVNSRIGKVSICCRSLVGGYSNYMFLVFKDLLDYSQLNDNHYFYSPYNV